MKNDEVRGISLYVEYDALFDKGFISFTDNLEIIIVSDQSKFSDQLKDKLQLLNGRQLRQPLNKTVNVEYLEYHRKNIFKG